MGFLSVPSLFLGNRVYVCLSVDLKLAVWCVVRWTLRCDRHLLHHFSLIFFFVRLLHAFLSPACWPYSEQSNAEMKRK